MNDRPRVPHSGVPGSTVRFVLVSILAVAVLFPPETRGESAAGCAILALLLALLTTRDVDPNATRGLTLTLALAWPLWLLSLAPGVAPEPLAAMLLAATVGVCAAARSHDLRAGRALPVTLTIVAVLVSVSALFQVFHGLDALAQSIESTPALPDRELMLARLRAGRAFAAFATPAALGGFLAIALPITIGLAWESAARKRLMLGAAVALQACALAATSSASAAGALFAGVVLLFLRRAGSARAFTLAIFAALTVLAGIVALRGSTLIDPTAAESPWRLRAGNVRAALAMAADHPWTGVGPGSFGEAYPLYRRPGDNETRHAHDMPAEWLAEYGVPMGALLSVVFFWLFAGPLLARARPGPAWIEGARVGLAAFALHNLVDFTAAFPSFLLAVAILRGACARELPARASRVRWTPVAAALLAGAIVALSGLSSNARGAARREWATAPVAEALSKRALALAPWNPDCRMLRAEVLLRSAPPRLAPALAESDAAVRLSPLRASARALRARVRAALGDVPGAFADFDEATRLYPMRPEYARDRDVLASRLPDSGLAKVER